MTEQLNQEAEEQEYLSDLLPRADRFQKTLFRAALAAELADIPLGKPNNAAMIAAKGLANSTRALLDAEVKVWDDFMRGEGRSGQLVDWKSPEVYQSDHQGNLLYKRHTDHGQSGLLQVKGLFDGLHVLDTTGVKYNAKAIVEADSRPDRLIVCIELANVGEQAGQTSYIPLVALENIDCANIFPLKPRSMDMS